jgi:hypothetical protein
LFTPNSRLIDITRQSLTALLIVAASLAVASDSNHATDPAPLFAEESVLDVTIEAPLTTLMEDRPEEAYLDGAFHYTEPDGTAKTLSLKLRTRGNYRRDPEHCDFAPIRLNFRKSELSDTIFAGQDKLKLVTHCRTHKHDYEQHVAREYLAYHFLRQLTSISFGVRMFRITYVDVETGDEHTRLGFVIEEDDAVAKRNSMELVLTRFIDAEDLDRRRQNLIHVFEYMVGNTEYSLVNPEPGKNCCHNMEVLSATQGPPYVPMPFDFDFSGMVNAEYAQPNPLYPIRRVSVRFYKGICANNDLLPETLDLFNRHREALLGIIAESDFLSNRSRRSTTKYIDAFFKTISDPKTVRRELLDKCNREENAYGADP